MRKTKRKKTSPAKKKGTGSSSKRTPLDKQPQSKQDAARQVGLFLHTDDAWSEAYFNSGDLHGIERELFG